MPRKKKQKKVGFDLSALPDIQVPDPPTRNVKNPGRTSGLGMHEFIGELLLANERCPIHSRRTNAALLATILYEYNDDQELEAKFTDTQHPYTVNYFRHLFNIGRLTRGERPPALSYRYNENGVAVDTRTGKKPLTPEQRTKYKEKYDAYWQQ